MLLADTFLSLSFFASLLLRTDAVLGTYRAKFVFPAFLGVQTTARIAAACLIHRQQMFDLVYFICVLFAEIQSEFLDLQYFWFASLFGEKLLDFGLLLFSHFEQYFFQSCTDLFPVFDFTNRLSHDPGMLVYFFQYDSVFGVGIEQFFY